MIRLGYFTGEAPRVAIEVEADDFFLLLRIRRENDDDAPSSVEQPEILIDYPEWMALRAYADATFEQIKDDRGRQEAAAADVRTED